MGPYYSHISFFLEPIPLDIISELFGGTHNVWCSGNQLYQYTVDPHTIGEFKYSVVESPEKTKLLYDPTVTDADYEIVLASVIKQHGYIGSGVKQLIRATKSLVGTTRKYYKLLPGRPNFKAKLSQKYAATVPHVMIYPATGEILYQDVQQVVVG